MDTREARKDRLENAVCLYSHVPVTGNGTAISDGMAWGLFLDLCIRLNGMVEFKTLLEVDYNICLCCA